MCSRTSIYAKKSQILLSQRNGRFVRCLRITFIFAKCCSFLPSGGKGERKRTDRSVIIFFRSVTGRRGREGGKMPVAPNTCGPTIAHSFVFYENLLVVAACSDIPFQRSSIENARPAPVSAGQERGEKNNDNGITTKIKRENGDRRYATGQVPSALAGVYIYADSTRCT